MILTHVRLLHSMLEDGGTSLSFGKTCERCQLKCVIRVHNPQFYWKVLFVLSLRLAYFILSF